VVMECTEPNTFTAKSGKEMTKRTMQICDASGTAIEVAIFGQPAQTLGVGNVIAIKGAKVGSWNSKSLTLWNDAPITQHPDMPEAHQLLGWWASQQQSGAGVRSLSVQGGGSGGGKPAPRYYFSHIDDYALGMNAEPDHLEVRCTITHIRTDQRTLWYVACPNCKKKLANADEVDLQGHCEKCDKTVLGTRRWIFQVTANDTSGSRYVSLFDQEAVQLLGNKTADELAPLKTIHDNTAAFDAHFQSRTFQTVILKCRVKNDTYQDEARLKIQATHIRPVDFVEEGRGMLQEIAQMQAVPGHGARLH